MTLRVLTQMVPSFCLLLLPPCSEAPVTVGISQPLWCARLFPLSDLWAFAQALLILQLAGPLPGLPLREVDPHQRDLRCPPPHSCLPSSVPAFASIIAPLTNRYLVIYF